MQIRFTPTEQDWRSAIQGAPRSAWGSLQFFLTFVPLFFLGGYLGAGGYQVAGWSCAIASIGIALASYEVPRLHQRKEFRTSSSAQGERSVSVDETGITITVPHGHSQYDWRAFTQYRETKSSFLVFMSSQRVSFWIPKRVMSAAQIEELRGILKIRLTAAQGGF
jgi:hypothetical protein